VLFDQGAITIEDDFTLLGRTGRLSLHPQHSIDVLHLRYHREHYGG
jgi:putative restriction endonuclease